MVEKRGELFLLPLPCGLPYTAQRLGHASPALRPVRALLTRVPLGPRPWLRQLRHRSPGFVRRSCINGYGSSPYRYGLSDPTGPMFDPEISRFPRKEHARVSDHACSDRRSQ
jgi:hypothetical protein